METIEKWTVIATEIDEQKRAAYKTVLEDLREAPMFRGIYDAEHGNVHFMWGVGTVMEAIADRAGEDGFGTEFARNMIKSMNGG